MFEKEIEKTIFLLRKNNIRLEKGMTEEQIVEAERYYGIRFPPDLKALLKMVLPISFPFFDWTDFSSGNEHRISECLVWPKEGILWDYESSGIWFNDLWGEKPKSDSQRINVINKSIEEASKLIPIYSHRYIPSYPLESGNPIFSVHQTDIIYYGESLWDYFEYEFNRKEYTLMNLKRIKRIPFWSYFADI